MTGTCRLCLNEKELRHSHILPEFMYQNLYDATPKRFYSLKVTPETENSKQKIEQKGIREYLLCGDCEVKISKYENYAAETIYAKNKGNKASIAKTSISSDHTLIIYDYIGFSYNEFKIFLESILWRIIISESFNTPDIEPELTERLRLSIFNEASLEYDDCGCLLQAIKYNQRKIAGGFILDPFLTQSKRSRILNILIDGLMYSYYLDTVKLIEEDKEFFLKRDGSAKIMGRFIFHDPSLFEKVKKAFNFFKPSK